MSHLRNGNFTSGEIFNLISEGKEKGTFGKPALTYIQGKNYERKLNRALNSDVSARPTSWGNLVELHAFGLLDLNYKITSEQTIIHPEHSFWVGTPDGVNRKTNTVFDIKCPFTLKSFCELVECKTAEELRENHKDGEKYYWQLVSNAILTISKFAELIVYCPYKSELEAIRELASNFDGDQNKIAWIGFSQDDDLPYLIEGGHYKNLNIIRFEVSEEDKKALTERVIKAGKMLIKCEEEIIIYNEKIHPTEQQILSAQEKIASMNELKTKLKHVI